MMENPNMQFNQNAQMNPNMQISPDVNKNSEKLHRCEVEDHLRWMHAMYKQGKESHVPSQLKPRPDVTKIKFKSDNVDPKNPIDSNSYSNQDLVKSEKSVESESQSSGINSINRAISQNQDLTEQRHDKFDPTGTVDWGIGDMGGFFAQQINIPGNNSTNNQIQD